MPNANDIKDLADTVSNTLDTHLKTRGRTLSDRIPRAKKKLPRKLAASLEKISAAEHHAKIRPQVSQKQLEALRKEQQKIEKHVGNIDRPAQRKQALRGWATALVFNIALFAGAMTLWIYVAQS